MGRGSRVAGFYLLGGVSEEGVWGAGFPLPGGSQRGSRVSSIPGLYTIHSDGAGFPLLVKLIQAEGVGECRSRVPLPDGGWGT